MKLPKHIPTGHTLRIKLAPDQFELVTFPATKTKPERQKWCHKVLRYSIHKSETLQPWRHKSEHELLRQIRKELKNAKKK